MKVLLRSLITAGLFGAAIPAFADGIPAKPRLVVLISIDQFRADYLTRFEDLYLPPVSGKKVGGFRYLMEKGAYYPDAHHDHVPLSTGPGHSVLLTGAPPYKSGIIANDWWDRATNKLIYCVQDDTVQIVGSDSKIVKASPEHLKVTTLGDELKMTTGRQAKVFGLSLKDRASILMAGHLADAAYWFDPIAGQWISSTYYFKDDKLPDWMVKLNSSRPTDVFYNKVWDFSEGDAAKKRLFTPTGEYAADVSGMGTMFPHKVSSKSGKPDANYFKAFTTSPFGNTYVFNTARELIKQEALGQDNITDILAINLASNDYVGHAFGPDSAEMLDIAVKTDKELSDFFNDLDKSIPGGLGSVDIVLTADHGVAPIGPMAHKAGLPGGSWPKKAVLDAVNAALVERFGPGKYTADYSEPYLWLDHEVIKAKKVDLAEAQTIAAKAAMASGRTTDGIPALYAAFTPAQILSGSLPPTDISRHLALGFHPLLSGDVLIVAMPGVMPSDYPTGTTHSEPYAYDTHVPLLIAGTGIRPGTYTERVSTLDIAPTLAFLLHVNQPSGCEGRILTRAMLNDGPRGK
ncbi:MAG: alkaline phosphatase family protein [Chthonomonadales bacterium]